MPDPERKKYTNKQMGDACEMLVAAELTLAGIPALKVPDLWPGYDVIAQPIGKGTQRISVKSRTFKTGPGYVEYNIHDTFDWLAIVLLGCTGDKPRRIFVIPRAVADRESRRDKSPKTAHLRYWRIDEVAKVLGNYEDNFTLAAG
jgi:hypothetical protein